MNAQLRAYARPGLFRNGIQGKQHELENGDFCGKFLVWDGEHIATGDWVRMGARFFLVQGCYQSSSGCWLLVRLGEFKSKVTAHANVVTIGVGLHTLALGGELVRCVAAWSDCDNGDVLVII